ncbi:universal stress protein [Magnetospirillum sp. UT-4]|uniref:universal stress protein n=1 Tax=Magnetospirillum sp. UT-4 TaxID=2681467 RepID=UPI00137E4836|nr:universal stress protein [Magnetospirillum sp. UT-4]CAA7612742.1 conserved hypothetical protein [Magnetospirillum sp. UT-4]
MSDGGFRRIVAAVDASPLSLAAAATACSLAVRFGAEIEGLFVEDRNVARLASHPYVHTVSFIAARRQAGGDALIGKAMELQAMAARRAMDAALAVAGARGGFHVRRGLVEAELVAASHGADLVCLGWSGRAEPGARPRLGSVARALAGGVAGAVLVMQRTAPGGGPVTLLWDDSAAAERALAVAVRLAGDGIVDLMVPAPDAIAGAALAVRAVGLAEGLGAQARIRAAGRLARLLAVVAGDGILVAPAGTGMPLDDLPCSVLLVR